MPSLRALPPRPAEGLRAPGLVHSLLEFREQIQKRVLYDDDCSHRHKGVVVAGQRLVNDLVTIFFPSGFLTPAPITPWRVLPARDNRPDSHRSRLGLSPGASEGTEYNSREKDHYSYFYQ
jgi:hypothetical protein